MIIRKRANGERSDDLKSQSLQEPVVFPSYHSNFPAFSTASILWQRGHEGPTPRQ